MLTSTTGSCYSQARRVPLDIASRYHAHSIDWMIMASAPASNMPGAPRRRSTTAIRLGAAYRAIVDPLDLPDRRLGPHAAPTCSGGSRRVREPSRWRTA